MEQINQDKNVRLCYFMIPTNKGIGYVCMALRRPEKDSGSISYKAAFSFCSPQEGKQFSKQKARLMATGRLATWERDSGNRVDFESNAQNLTDVFKQGFELLAKNGNVPSWVRKRKDLIFGLNSNSKVANSAETT